MFFGKVQFSLALKLFNAVWALKFTLKLIDFAISHLKILEGEIFQSKRYFSNFVVILK